MKTKGKLLEIWNESVHEKAAIICCIFMIAGLFFSRALLSLSMFLMFVNALHPAYIVLYWNQWRRNAFSLLCLGFFASYLVSGIWSANVSFWWAATVNKLPFVILPFAFLSIPLYQYKTRRIIILSLALMQLVVIIYSISQLALHWDYYLKGYNFSRPIPTTKYNDHIRFSLSLVISVFLMLYLLLEEKKEHVSRILRGIIVASIIIFIVYIHILAAKTGIVCLYLGALLFVISKLWRSRKMLAILLSLMIAALPVVGYYTIPTFRTKIQYVGYEYFKTKSDKHLDYTLSDAGRLITYEIGGSAILQHPLAGVGAGDIMDEMKAGYQARYPEVSADQQFGPINQYLFTALSVGIPLTLILVVMSFGPLFFKNRKKIYLSITTLVLCCSLMVEYPLELQFGVMTYLFFMLTWLGITSKEKVDSIS